ncbi:MULTISPECIES: ZIP family metal transporter [Paenibacillus]|uniref:ZIP family metal transporter n=1 Tax=Paenibacillus TaxID=44249 RepID=UPI0022B86A9F|nr:ZIP family metal transporter [Paenibacillus caseinilyticus]MCZ8522168.1 ZIP family metal transporter [Paenibacillus caseinilyticus]
MWQAAMWGAVSGSAVLLGALAAILFDIPKKIIGYIMAFGTGVLIGAAAYELLGESVRDGGLMPTTAGFLIGAAVFTGFDVYISRKGGAKRKRSGHDQEGGEAEAGGSGLAIFAGTVMDAVPESIMIGASLLEGGSVSWLLVIAIFLSNIPEGLSSTAGLRKGGYSKPKILVLWAAVMIISSLCSLGGYAFMENASEAVLAFIAAFAGGGIIAMVASTMMPEAYEEGGPVIGFIASLGLLVSLVLDHLS